MRRTHAGCTAVLGRVPDFGRLSISSKLGLTTSAIFVSDSNRRPAPARPLLRAGHVNVKRVVVKPDRSLYLFST